MFMEQEPHYIPLSLIINTKYIKSTKQCSLSSITIMFYLEDVVVQKGTNFIHFIRILP